ncbi:tetraspanin-8-like [Apium graveolens]|uniref:Uncharacterized protein n=1 Tax=Apium graveolens TaxID=4045 RepID=A0A6L5BC26_APIGR|nr:hypothetical protein AG4045_029397 [Apium graveolens]
MGSASNKTVTVLNFLTLIVSVAAIGFSVWLMTHPGSLCQSFIQKPLLCLGLVLLGVSILGIVGSCYGVSVFLCLYVVLMFVLVLGLIGFTIFSVIVTNKGVGQAISGKGYKEYRLGDYSNWLRKYVVNGKNWGKIKSCLVDVHVCSSLSGVKTAHEFDERPLSPLQSGCCKPPADCGFQFKNATFWIAPEQSQENQNTDCTTWSNKQDELCFNCSSCKAGVLNGIKKQWKLLAIISICVTLVVIVIYSLGCCALKNSRNDKYFMRMQKGYY